MDTTYLIIAFTSARPFYQHYGVTAPNWASGCIDPTFQSRFFVALCKIMVEVKALGTRYVLKLVV